jgi:hypothetical protein
MRLRLPFVVTVLGSAAVACGGKAVLDGDLGAGGDGGSGASGSGASGSGASGSGASGSGASGSGGIPIQCPAAPPGPDTPCSEPPVARCSYDVACQSGVVPLSFQCNGIWEIVADSCVSYDSCPGTEYYCLQTNWYMPSGSNPPTPCPSTAPPEGTPCQPVGMGGDWEYCGYWCPGSQSAWTVATCTQQAPMTYAWIYDGACEG